MIDSVREFNRVVTERIGALQDEYLARGRPLGASRVLWEIGSGAGDVRVLRSRLGLDSGYLSRLLRSLEAEDLIATAPAAGDARVREVRVTAKGQREWRVLDQRSNDLASSLLEPLDARQRERLVEAMDAVRILLTAGLVTISVEDPSTADAQRCLGRYFAELDARFEGGFDSTVGSADAEDLTEPAGLLLVARLRNDPIGCGGLTAPSHGPAEIKRMWISPSARGLGLGRRLLRELEARAIDRGVHTVRLETNRALTEAIGLYRSAGYAAIDAFGEDPHADRWFQKTLTRPTST